MVRVRVRVLTLTLTLALTLTQVHLRDIQPDLDDAPILHRRGEVGSYRLRPRLRPRPRPTLSVS